MFEAAGLSLNLKASVIALTVTLATIGHRSSVNS